MTRQPLRIWATALILLLSPLWIGAFSVHTIQHGVTTYFVETGITLGDGSWIRLDGTYQCIIYADAWTTGNVDVETLVDGTTASPTKVMDIGVAALVDVTADTAWSRMEANGWFRIEVEGPDTINWHCRQVISRVF